MVLHRFQTPLTIRLILEINHFLTKLRCKNTSLYCIYVISTGSVFSEIC